MTTPWSDLRHAWRSLRRSPGFAAVAIGTLALGIGVTVAMFSVLEGVLLRPLPFADPERIVRIWESNPARGHARFDVLPGSFLDWREQSTSFDALALYRSDSVLLTESGETERLRAAFVSPALFRVLGVDPVLGRGFLPEDGTESGRPEIVLSHALWQRKYGGDPRVVGRTVTLGGWARLTVVGVMPRGFDFPAGTELWGQEVLTRAMGRGDRWRSAIGKLRAGTPIEAAHAELGTIARRAQIEHPQTNAGWNAALEPLSEVMIGGVGPGLVALFAAVLALLLIACANVASAVLARASVRRHEMAIRTALGATRWRLLRLALTEGLLITALAGGLGLLLADTLLDVLIARAPAAVPRLAEIGINGPAIAFAVGLSLLTVLVFGAASWAPPDRRGVEEQLKSGSGRFSAPGRVRAGAMLVGGEVAVSLLLLAGAGLLLETFVRLNRLDLGFEPSGVWSTELAVPVGRFSPPEGMAVGRRPEWQRVAAFFPDALERIRTIPGVESAALVELPPNRTETPGFFRHGRTFGSASHLERWPVVANPITPDYFRVLRIPLRRGRAFTDQDRAAAARVTGTGPGAPGVAIVNEAIARRHWPGRDPIGQEIALEGDSWVAYRTIVGIVGDTLRSPLERDPEPLVYVPLAQSRPRFELTLVARVTGDSGAAAAPVRSALRGFDSALSVPPLQPLERLLGTAVEQHRFAMLLVSVFGALALGITAAGLYGVIALIVSQRTREIGIRVALGARPADVVRLVAGYALAPVAGGVLLGLIGALWAGRVLPAVVTGARPADPLTLLAAGALLVLAAGIALFAPIRSATAVDPISVLRAE